MGTTNQVVRQAKRYAKENINLVSFCLELIIISAFAFIITLFQAGFDVTKINWTVFTFTDIFNIYCRIIATKYSADREKMINTDINALSNVIKNRKMAIIRLGKQEAVEKTLQYYNYQKSFEYYVNELHKKNDKINLDFDVNNKRQERKLKKRQNKRRRYDTRIKQASELIDLIINRDFETYDTKVLEYHLRSYSKKYCDIHYNDLFVGKSKQDKNGQDKTTFNLATTSIGRALPSFIALTIISMFWSSLDPNINNSADAWFMLGSYSFAIIMGTTWGLRNGREAVEQDLNAVLNTDLEIITRILKDANCLDEVDNLISQSS